MFPFATPNNPEKLFQATYVWMSRGGVFRYKIYTLSSLNADGDFDNPDLYPTGTFDGSSTGDAEVGSSDLRIKPCAVYRDVDGVGVFVLCDIDTAETPRANLLTLIENRKVFGAESCWFGFEQEYFLLPFESESEQDAFHYCSPTSETIPQHHYNECRQMGVHITGWNCEVAPNQYEFQVCAAGVSAADDLIMARWVLLRVCQEHDKGLLLVPKPIPVYNGSGLHTNFSTPQMRTSPGGWSTMLKSVGLLRDRHNEHMEVYGDGNEERLSGMYETSAFDTFSWGIGSRDTSVRLQKVMKGEDKGFIEDRRPASNANPYVVCYALVNTCVLDLSVYTNAVLEPL